MKKYGEMAIAILEEIADIASRGAAFTEAMLTVGATVYLYPSVEKRFAEIMRRNNSIKERERQRRRFSQTLYRLKKEGIVMRDDSGILILTPRGERILKEGKEFLSKKLPSISSYRGNVANETVVVIFDIPEAQREKREWFREVIIGLGFSMAQKSVWIGDVGIPEQLLRDLGSLSLLAYIKFFTVVGRGTLLECQGSGSASPFI
jgi:hypothetical protein